jgi:hypothetical protein
MVQRWRFRRVGLILLSFLVVVAAGFFCLSLFFPSRVGDVLTPSCDTNRTMVLMAQAVPSAEQLPSIESLPLGWSLSGATIARDRATFVLSVVGGGESVQQQLGPGGRSPAVNVNLTPACAEGDEPTIRAIEMEGGCVAYDSSLPPGLEPVPSFEADGGLSLLPRSQLVGFVESDEDLTSAAPEHRAPEDSPTRARRVRRAARHRTFDRKEHEQEAGKGHQEGWGA